MTRAQTGLSLQRFVGPALHVQVGWALLSAAWNFVGVYAISNGMRAPGPTATLGGAAVLLAIAAALAGAIGRWPVLYAVLSAATGVAAAAAVSNALTASPALWPSESWRWAGIVLNTAGLLAALAAVVGFARWTMARRATNRTS